MGEAAEHVFNRKTASPALLQAMEDLAEQRGGSVKDLDGMNLGDAYQLAVETYRGDLPDFWRIWNDWNQYPDEPAPMGDL